MSLRILTLLLVLLVCGAAQAQVEAKPGETLFHGTVLRVLPDGDRFELGVTATTPWGGKKTDAERLVRRIVATGAQTHISPRGDANWLLPFNEIQTEREVIVAGEEGGANRPINARIVALDRNDGGKPIDFYVAKAGNDATGDGSLEKPWKTVQFAVGAVPNGREGVPRVLHIGPGEFLESVDGRIGQLLVRDKEFLVLTGAGAKAKDGTHISGEGHIKHDQAGVLRLENSHNVDIRNLIVGDDYAFDTERFFEATIYLDDDSTAWLDSVWIRGPLQKETQEAGRQRTPTVCRSNGPKTNLTLHNVLVTGHGTFLSNPEGYAWCSKVTFAQMYGVGYDDNFLFLQAPIGPPEDERRFVFSECLFYELAGSKERGHLILSTGEHRPDGRSDGQSKVYFFPPDGAQSGNLLVRGRDGDGFIETNTLSRAFDLRDDHFTRVHGLYRDDDTQGETTKALEVRNELKLETRDGYEFVAPEGVVQGWQGGTSSPLGDALETQKTANP